MRKVVDFLMPGSMVEEEMPTHRAIAIMQLNEVNETVAKSVYAELKDIKRQEEAQRKNARKAWRRSVEFQIGELEKQVTEIEVSKENGEEDESKKFSSRFSSDGSSDEDDDDEEDDDRTVTSSDR